jgi:hypothetical protein
MPNPEQLRQFSFRETLQRGVREQAAADTLYPERSHVENADRFEAGAIWRSSSWKKPCV